MTFSIAVAGKGGSGKTSLTSLIIRYLLKHQNRPVLAVDADPNANLGESLGLEVKETVGTMLAKFQDEKIDIPAGMTKESYIGFKLNSILVENKGFDLMSMGRGEGQGCYCYPNVILKKFIDQLTDNYSFVVLDNEAGMEHLSRGTTQDIDELLIVSNHSVKGVRTIARIKELVAELKLRAKHQSVIINMVPDGLDPLISQELDKLGIKPDAVVAEDEQIVNFDLNHKSLIELPEDAKSVQSVNVLMEKITRPVLTR